MKFIKLAFFFTAIISITLASPSDLFELETTLINIVNQASKIKPIVAPLPKNKSTFYKMLRTEIEKSLKNKNTKNLNLVVQTEPVKTAKYIIKNFFPNGFNPSDDRFGLIANYILLISEAIEFLKETKSPTNKSISILSVNGMINPETYLVLIAALDKAHFKLETLAILGNIDDIKNIDNLKQKVNAAFKSGHLSTKTEIEYYKTIPELLAKNHRIDLYLYNFRLTEPLMGTLVPNAMYCTLKKSNNYFGLYFLPQDQKSPIIKSNQTKFLIPFSLDFGTLPDKLLRELGLIETPSKMDLSDYECQPLEEEATYIFNIITSTKTKNIVPLFCYTDKDINLIKLPTNDIISSISSIIQTRRRLIFGLTKKLPLYQWDKKTSRFLKSKNI